MIISASPAAFPRFNLLNAAVTCAIRISGCGSSAGVLAGTVCWLCTDFLVKYSKALKYSFYLSFASVDERRCYFVPLSFFSCFSYLVYVLLGSQWLVFDGIEHPSLFLWLALLPILLLSLPLCVDGVLQLKATVPVLFGLSAFLQLLFALLLTIITLLCQVSCHIYSSSSTHVMCCLHHCILKSLPFDL